MYALFVNLLCAFAVLGSARGKLPTLNCSLDAAMVATKSKGYSVFVFVEFPISRVIEPILLRSRRTAYSIDTKIRRC